MKKIFGGLALAPLLIASCGSAADTTKVVNTSQAFKDEVSSCYSLMPNSFADGNGDGKGDLIGVTNKLEYLANDLGVTCIWMTPVSKSGSYHKYDVNDYKSIDEQFGDIDDYKNLLTKAKDLNIKVLFDLVPNHTGIGNIWWTYATVQKDPKYINYYNIKDISDSSVYPNKSKWYSFGDVNGKPMHYYASFWDKMPELNLDNNDVRNEFKSIAKFWLDLGVAGFRIDAAQHVYDLNEYPVGTPTLEKNVGFFKDFSDYVKKQNKDAYVVGEIYNDSTSYKHYLEGMDSAFEFDTARGIISSVNANRNNYLEGYLEDDVELRKHRSDYISTPFITNHDQDRAGSQFSNNDDKKKIAANTLLTLPGIPFIYYGEEIGMTGSGPHEDVRQPMKWSSNASDSSIVNGAWSKVNNWDAMNNARDSVVEQLADANSVLRTYKNALEYRKNNPVIVKGTVTEVDMSSSSIAAYNMEYNGTKIMVIHNFGSQATARPIESNLSIDTTFVTGASIANGNINIPAYGTVILKHS